MGRGPATPGGQVSASMEMRVSHLPCSLPPGDRPLCLEAGRAGDTSGGASAPRHLGLPEGGGRALAPLTGDEEMLTTCKAKL